MLVHNIVVGGVWGFVARIRYDAYVRACCFLVFTKRCKANVIHSDDVKYIQSMVKVEMLDFPV